MFPIVPLGDIIALIAIEGAIIGLVSGYVSARILSPRVAGVWKDVVFGAVGSCVAFLAAISIPVPENTVTTRLPHGVMTSTANRFQHPYVAAFVLAAIVPVVHQVIRFMIAKKIRHLSEGGVA